ncbi:hypothetical protein ODI_R1223 [Orrella dioscoreae]|uniref:Uncharacterized protein n=2 Tax=Orrella dioscoreae TaxID=1851544 RepID=A0A1C3K7S4_9BURK|nr:hypothetical protein ODI_02458 [Orrella dioscoreae]SOE48082.1 hypothetical protein ODI_R1223 [Orrella dioscoreae]
MAPWLSPHPKLEGISLMGHLYNRLDGMYPNRWRAAFADGQDAIDAWTESWAEAFADEGLVPQDIATGLRNCRRMFDWPPSLAEFVRACRPHLAPENAFQEAVRGMLDRSRGEKGQWSHPAIFWAAVRVGQHDIMHLGYAVMKTRWEAALRDILHQGQWKDIPEVSMALPAPGNTQADRDAAAKQMRELGAGAALDQTGRDPRRWIAKVQQRCADGRKPSPTVLAMLQRATGGAA